MSATTRLLGAKAAAADSQRLFELQANGKALYGPGGSTSPDLTVERDPAVAGQLKVGGKLRATGDINADAQIIASGVISSAVGVTVQGGLGPDTLVLDAGKMAVNQQYGSTSPGAALGTNLVPVFLPFLPHDGDIVKAIERLGVRVTTANNPSTVGIAIYDFTFTGTGAMTASRMATLSAAINSNTSTGALDQTLTGAPITIDWRQNRPYIGVMVSNVGTLRLAAAGKLPEDANAYKFTGAGAGAARSSTTDWPTSFTETAISGAGTATSIPFVYYISTYGLRLTL